MAKVDKISMIADYKNMAKLTTFPTMEKSLQLKKLVSCSKTAEL
jgi:hypothetical protein